MTYSVVWKVEVRWAYYATSIFPSERVYVLWFDATEDLLLLVERFALTAMETINNSSVINSGVHQWQDYASPQSTVESSSSQFRGRNILRIEVQNYMHPTQQYHDLCRNLTAAYTFSS